MKSLPFFLVTLFLGFIFSFLLFPTKSFAQARTETLIITLPNGKPVIPCPTGQTCSKVYSDTETINIQIKANWDRFELGGKKYRLKVFPERDLWGVNPLTEVYVTRDLTATDTRTLELTGIPIRTMYAHGNPRLIPEEFGNRNWRVEVKSLNGLGTEENRIFIDSFFVHTQCSSADDVGCPALVVKQYVFQVGDPIELEIWNAQADKNYAVWWVWDETTQIVGDAGVRYDPPGWKWSGTLSSGAISSGNPTKADIPPPPLPAAQVDQAGKGHFCMTKGTIVGGAIGGLACTFRTPPASGTPNTIRIQTEVVSAADEVPKDIASNAVGTPTEPPRRIEPSPYPSVPPPCTKYVLVDDDGKEGPDVTENVLRPTHPVAPLPPTAKYKCVEVDTAIGPIETSAVGIVKRLFAVVLSLSGGIAVILIITSGYMIMTSQGNAEKLQKAREILTSAIVGLLFMIFSMVILNTVGIDILAIPGLTK